MTSRVVSILEKADNNAAIKSIEKLNYSTGGGESSSKIYISKYFFNTYSKNN